MLDALGRELPPHRRHRRERRVVLRREQETEPRRFQLRRNPSGGRSSGTPSAASTSAPPLLDVMARLPCLTTAAPPPASTKRHRGRDVEEVKPVAARAAHVDDRAGQPGGVDFRVHRAGEQRAGETGDFGGRLALGAQGAQEGGLGGVGRAGSVRAATAASICAGASSGAGRCRKDKSRTGRGTQGFRGGRRPAAWRKNDYFPLLFLNLRDFCVISADDSRDFHAHLRHRLGNRPAGSR